MNRTKEELLVECITQFEHLDEINESEPKATTVSLIREIKQVLNLPDVIPMLNRECECLNSGVNCFSGNCNVCGKPKPKFN